MRGFNMVQSSVAGSSPPPRRTDGDSERGDSYWFESKKRTRTRRKSGTDWITDRTDGQHRL